MAFTQITSTNIKANTVAGYAEFANFAASLAPRVSYANVANSLYFTVDDTAVNVGGGYIVVTGANFQSGATVLIDTVQASAVTYVDSTTLRVQVPARSAATYSLYVVNPDGGTGIRVNALTYSSEPTWVTSSPLSNQNSNTAFNVTLSATGATSYSVAAGSTLPAGTTLAANGYFSGTVSIGAETTYTFDVVATDAENQDSSKTFQVTVTVIPPVRLFSWGRNNYGQLGHGDTVYRSSPVQVGSSTTWSQIISGANHIIATKTDGTLWAWGRNDNGQLGFNDVINRSSPVQVGVATTWNLVSVGSYSVMATKTDGTLWLWGNNNAGQLGLNSQGINRSSPTQIGSATNWSLIDGGNATFVAIKTDGTLWIWGDNSQGQLGLNDVNVSKSSPTQVGSGTDWSKINAGGNHILAIKTDGTLWACGLNNAGQVGNNSVSNRSSPVQVGSSTTWSQINTGPGSTLSLSTKTDGTLWSWGSNFTGQLGHGDTVYRSSPTQVGVATTWSQISVGQRTVGTIKTDGTLWTWGSNVSGVLGNNSVVNRSSPVQVGSSTTWNLVNVGSYSVIARTS